MTIGQSIELNARYIARAEWRAKQARIHATKGGRFIDVIEPDECEHPDNYREIREVGASELSSTVVFCNACKKIGVPEPPDEDGEVFLDWREQ